MGIRIEDLNWKPVNPRDRAKWFGSEAVEAVKSEQPAKIAEEPARGLAEMAHNGAGVECSVEGLKSHFELESPNRDGEGPPDDVDFARLPASPSRPPSRDALRQPVGGAALAFA